MEDTRSLLAMVMQKVFHDQPKVVDDTYKLIYGYNSSCKEKGEYEKTLKTICVLVNEKLPPQILVYLLTLVDLPKEDGGAMPIIEKMQRTHNCLPESVRPHLLGYLNSNKPRLAEHPPMEKKVTELKVQVVEEKKENIQPPVKRPQDNKFLKPVKRPRTRKRGKNIHLEDFDDLIKPLSLLDITANYVIQNEQNLKKMYKKQQEEAWNLINSDCYTGDNLQKCYEVVKDLNKKTKLLRMIENDNITVDIFFDEYRESDIFLKEKHMYDAVYGDPFDVADQLNEGVKLFIEQLKK